jgi:hypothetical protein
MRAYDRGALRLSAAYMAETLRMLLAALGPAQGSAPNLEFAAADFKVSPGDPVAADAGFSAGRVAERDAIAANLEAEAEIGRWHWEGRDALRSFARRLRELGDDDE